MGKNQINELDSYLKKIEKRFILTKKLLNKVYSFDIVHPKYRGLIPICSFYEYLDTGICQSLEGHEGAYRQYENDIKLNRIITSLDKINEKLDAIMNYQSQLYAELQIIRKNQESLCSQIDTLCQANEKIVNNTSVIKHDNQVIAKNSEIVKWITVFETYYQSKANNAY